MHPASEPRVSPSLNREILPHQLTPGHPGLARRTKALAVYLSMPEVSENNHSNASEQQNH